MGSKKAFVQVDRRKIHGCPYTKKLGVSESQTAEVWRVHWVSGAMVCFPWFIFYKHSLFCIAKDNRKDKLLM